MIVSPLLILRRCPQPFMEASLRSDFIRGYVRLYKTPPAKLRVDSTAEEQARLSSHADESPPLCCTYSNPCPCLDRGCCRHLPPLPASNTAPASSHCRILADVSLPAPPLAPQARLLLLILVRRHWDFHGPTLTGYLSQMGTLESVLQSKIDAMESEQVCCNRARPSLSSSSLPPA